MTIIRYAEKDAVSQLDETALARGLPDVQAPAAHVQTFDSCEVIFQTHYQHLAAVQSGSYNDHRPIYRYGYDLGMDERYRKRAWESVEAAARSLWEARNPGTWAQFQATIRFAWATALATRDADS